MAGEGTQAVERDTADDHQLPVGGSGTGTGSDGRPRFFVNGTTFFDAIDEFIISIVPVFIGEGIPLIAPRHRTTPLTLRSVTPFPDGVVQVHYDVGRRRR